MKNLNPFIVLFAALLLIDTVPCFGFVSGTVTDAFKNPVFGASVTFTDESDSLRFWKAVTDANGKYQINIATSVNQEHETAFQPEPFLLEQNYPNPFNPTTIIPFTLSRPDHCILTVYNIQGQKVRNLMDDYFSAGEHSLRWNGLDDRNRPASAGVYFYQLRVGGKSDTKKMLLLDGGQVNSTSQLYLSFSTRKKSFRKTESFTFKVTITGKGILPLIIKGKEIVDGGTYNFVVPKEDNSLQIALLPGKEEPLAAIISDSKEGESLGLIAQKTADGSIEKITGGIFVANDASTLTVWFGEAGLPTVAEANDWIIKFSNYTESTVDISFTSSADTVHVEGVAISSEDLKVLRALGEAGIFGKSVYPGAARKTSNLLFNDYVAGAIKGVALGIEAAGCAVSAVVTIGMPIVAPVAAISCGSAFVSSVKFGTWLGDRDRVYGEVWDAAGLMKTDLTSFNITPEISNMGNPNPVLNFFDQVMTIVDIAYTDAYQKYKNLQHNYTIYGRILENGKGLADVSILITGAEFNETVKTGMAGSYSLSIVPDGIYIINPSKPGYTFKPDKVYITVSGADKELQDIIAENSGQQIINGITFISIPGGTFQMGDVENAGDPHEKPVHSVTLSGFVMSVYEITNTQYAAYLNAAKASGAITATSSSVTGTAGTYSNQEYIYLSGSYSSFYPYVRCWITYSNNTFSVVSGHENWPVVWVTWYGAKAFALYYGLDLPTESEWEYACRGGKQYKYGTDDGTLSTSNANYLDTGMKHPVAVGSYPKNPFGLYDMSGNVWEWCNDWYGTYPSGSVTNPTGAQTGSWRVIRGGSWYNSDYYCRSAFRYAYIIPGAGVMGFRVVRRDFSPQPSTFSLQGKVLENTSGLSGVSVRLVGAGKDTTAKTSSTGSFTFTGLPNGSYTLTPAKTDYTFTPPSATATVNGANVNVSDIAATKSSTQPPQTIQGITFVSIPGGTFQMGDVDGVGNSDEKPVHTVTVSGFQMSDSEITNAQYCVYLNAVKATGDITATSESVKGAKGAYSRQEYIYLAGTYSSYPDARCWITLSNNTFSVVSGKENYPIVWVTWYGSKAFALYYGLDLPTEAEWEYACQGGRQYKYGTDDGTLSTSKANYWDNGIYHPVDVGSYPKNPYGLNDMSGNVWEWCHDWYGNYSSSPATNPTGAQSGSTRVVRGGGWGNYDYFCRSATRSFGPPDGGGFDIGFRVVLR